MPPDTSAPPGWRPPRFGKYELTSPATTAVGRNKVYKAVDVQRRRQVALKLLPADFAADARRRDACRHAVGQAARVRDNAVVTVHELAEHNGTWFLTLELLEAPDLHEHVARSGPVAADEARRLLLQAAGALALAHRREVPLPALTPASFLVCPQGGRPALKLLPLDVLQEAAADGPRPCRPGDYRAPEAGPGKAPDLRGVVYALGGVACYLLTGRPPAAGPEPWSAAQSRASAPLLAVIRRMMARQPADRYPTFEALLKDLEAVPGTEAVRAKVSAPARPRAAEKTLAMAPAAPKSAPAPATADGRQAPAPAPAGRLRRGAPRWLVAALALLVVVLGAIVAVQDSRLRDLRAEMAAAAEEAEKAKKDAEGQAPPPEEVPVAWPPVLYAGAAALNPRGLHNEFEGPWAMPAPVPPDARVLRVSRLAGGAGDARAGKTFGSLAAACAAAPEGKTTVIEIFDNGPLFERSIRVSDRSLVLRAGPGYRPLVIWDAAAAKDGDGPPTFLSVDGGSLTLGNLEVAADLPADAGPACLLRVAGGEALAWNSTFSAAGRPRGGLTLLRFEAGSEGVKRCRLNRCFARGLALTALDVRGPAAEVMLDNCLVVGGEPPLLRCQAGDKARAPGLRVIRSTLVARRTLLQIEPAVNLTRPALRWMGWDALLVRSGRGPGGVLADLPANARPDELKWRAVNCLYAGWKDLLTGHDPIAVGAEDAWRKRWGLPEGDRAIVDPWDGLADIDPAEAPAPYFSTAQAAPLAYAATFGQGLLGCDLSQLPPARPAWLAQAGRGFQVPEVEVLKDGSAPPIPKLADGKYYGGRIDLSTTDLGAHLLGLRDKQKLGLVVVLHLTGSGEHKVSPVYLENTSLVLYFEPPARGKEPLVLVPDGPGEPGQTAAFQLMGGSLTIIGGHIRFPEGKKAKVPHYLIHVWGGNLQVHGARLEGPLRSPPDLYWGLVRLEGSGLVEPEGVRGLTLHETVLLTSRVGIHVAGAGARLRIQRSVLVAGGDVLHFQPGRGAPDRLNVQCVLEHNTLAGRQAAVYVEDVPGWALIGDPVLVQTRGNVFANPFAGEDGKAEPAGVFLAQGLALARGVAAWQGEGDVFDRRLFSYAWVAGPDGTAFRAAKAQPFAVWRRAWGPLGSRRPVSDVAFTGTLSLERPRLDVLRLPADPALRNVSAGADLGRLGVGAKKE
jgi:hypothetical protein